MDGRTSTARPAHIPATPANPIAGAPVITDADLLIRTLVEPADNLVDTSTWSTSSRCSPTSNT